MRKIIVLLLCFIFILFCGCQVVDNTDSYELKHLTIKVISDRSDYFRYKIDITPKGLVTVACGDPVDDFNVEKPLRTVQFPISASYFAKLLHNVNSYPHDGTTAYGENLWRFEIKIGSENYTYIYGIEHNKDMKKFEIFIDELMREIPMVKESWIFTLWTDGKL